MVPLESLAPCKEEMSFLSFLYGDKEERKGGKERRAGRKKKGGGMIRKEMEEGKGKNERKRHLQYHASWCISNQFNLIQTKEFIYFLCLSPNLGYTVKTYFL